jgi:hypothetical protein
VGGGDLVDHDSLTNYIAEQHQTIGIGNTAGKTAFETTDFYYHDTEADTYQRYTGAVWEDVGVNVDDATLEVTTDLHIKDDGVTLAKMDSGTAGALIVYDGSGDPVDIGVGGAGDVLTSNVGAIPTWEAAGAPGAHDLGGASHTSTGENEFRIVEADGSNGTRWVDPPTANIDHSGDVVTSGATATIQPGVVDLAMMTVGTPGGVIGYAVTTGAATDIGVGTGTQVLTSNASGTPTWEDATGGGQVDAVDGGDGVTTTGTTDITVDLVLDGSTLTKAVGGLKVTDSTYAPIAHVDSTDGHPIAVASTTDGFISGAELARLEGMDDNASSAGATGDSHAGIVTGNPHVLDAADVGAAPSAHVASTDGHPLAVAAGADGFLSGADKTLLDATSGANTGDSHAYDDAAHTGTLTLNKNAVGTPGGVIAYATTTGIPTDIGVGGLDQVLTTSTVGQTPTWEDSQSGVSTWIALSDTDPTDYAGQAGKFVRVNAAPDGLEFVDPPSGGVDNWIDLTDTDETTYTGEAGNIVRVNATPDGLEFVAAAGVDTDAIHSADTITSAQHGSQTVETLHAIVVAGTTDGFMTAEMATQLAATDAAGTDRPADEISTSGTNVTISQTAPTGADEILVTTSATAAGWETGTDVTALLDIATTALKGLAPATVDTDSAKYLSADGTYTAPTGGSGDVTGPGTHGDDLLWKSAGTDTNTLQVTGISIADTTNHITGAGNFNGVTVEDHSALHENGGADEISVADLSGLLADAQTPLGHAYSVHTDTVPSTDFANNTIAPARIETQSDSGAYIFNATGVPAYLGPGSDGDVLTSGGTGVIPAWTAPTGGPATDLATDGSDVAINSTSPAAANYILKTTDTTTATWQLDTSGILTGAVDPTTEGVEGNFYYNTVKQGFWYKDSGGWEEVGVIADDVTIEVDETNGLQLIDNAVTLDKMDGGTAGNLITYDASGDPSAVSTSATIGHVLKGAGAGAKPAFGTLVPNSFSNNTIAPARIETQSDSGAYIFNAAGVPSYLGPGNDRDILTSSGTGVIPSWRPSPTLTKSLTLETPTGTELFSFFYTPVAITLTNFEHFIKGTTNVQWQIMWGATADAAGTATHSTITTSSTSGVSTTPTTDPTIPADSYLWLDTSAITDTPTEFHVTVTYTED